MKSTVFKRNELGSNSANIIIICALSNEARLWFKSFAAVAHDFEPPAFSPNRHIFNLRRCAVNNDSSSRSPLMKLFRLSSLAQQWLNPKMIIPAAPLAAAAARRPCSTAHIIRISWLKFHDTDAVQSNFLVGKLSPRIFQLHAAPATDISFW